MRFPLNSKCFSSWAYKLKSVRAHFLISAVLCFISIISVRMLRAGQATAPPQPGAAEAHGVDLTILDKTCKPCAK